MVLKVVVMPDGTKTASALVDIPVDNIVGDNDLTLQQSVLALDAESGVYWPAYVEEILDKTIMIVVDWLHPKRSEEKLKED